MNNLTLAITIVLFGCIQNVSVDETRLLQAPTSPYVLVLGIAQDAGYPQAGCYKEHCMRAWANPAFRRSATSLALIDPVSKQKWLFEATPDIKNQLYELNKIAPDSLYQLSGVFLTHGHMGHYTGLMHFGREAMGTQQIKVFTMPRMEKYLRENGPWSQLVKLNNIRLESIRDSISVKLTSSIEVTPLQVPHRDEFTETVGFQVQTKSKGLLFIPDIDKWEKWSTDIKVMVENNDYALLDATFFGADELPGRDMSEIPHPFVVESLKLFDPLKISHKSKVHFIHFNHSNPLLIPNSPARDMVTAEYNLAEEGLIFLL